MIANNGIDVLAKIVQIARSYIGQTEKPGNAGFNDAHFEEKMKAVGFLKGQAWCAYFVELVYKESGVLPLPELEKLHSCNVNKTLENFTRAKYSINKTPSPGSLVVFNFGHIGIVSEIINQAKFKSIEGNTNDQGGREGYIVAEKIRPLSVVTYFIHPVKTI